MDALSLRDYFAAQALPSLVVAYMDDKSGQQLSAADLAHVAYSLADAMLEKREA